MVEEAMLNAPLSPDLQRIELVSGKAANTKGVRKTGLKATGYDKEYSENQDFLSHAGFRYAIILNLRVKQGGAVLAGPTCSS